MRKLLKDKRGSSLVLVLLTMSFIILLAGAIITMTITNIWLKAAQKKTQENFYTTDSVLDSIVAGIQNDSSKVSADAYSSALSGYAASMTAANAALSEKYTKDYLSTMITVLSGGTCTYTDGQTNYQFSDEVLKSYLTSQEVSYYIDHGTNPRVMELKNDSLVLKDISVYKEENSYETTLTTDICVEVPMVTTDAHSEYLDYAILADDQIIANANKAVINGSIYAGTVNRDVTDNITEVGVRSRAGICITHGGKLDINARYLITRGDLAMEDRGEVDIDGTGAQSAILWVENITTDAAPDASSRKGGNKIDIDGECNVADDMELNGKNDVAKISGSYFGYNYNESYATVNDVAVDASYSSAISLNGAENSLDFSGLSTLILSGRTFISKKASTTNEQTNIDHADEANSNIELGTSLSVKSSQLAYFVPSDYVKTLPEIGSGNYTLPASLPGEGMVKDGGKPETEWLFFEVTTTNTTTNVTKTTVYAFDYQSYNAYVMPDDTAYQTALQKTGDYSMIANKNHFDIRDYIGSGSAAGGGITYTYSSTASPLKVYYRHDKRVSQEAIKYFYLSFDTNNGAGGKTNKKAGIFYSVFHDSSPQQTGVYNEVDERYLSGNGVVLSGQANALMRSSGDILYGSPGTGTQIKIQSADPLADTSLYRYASIKSKEYMARQLSLLQDYTDSKESPLWRLTEINDGKLSKSGIDEHSVKVSNLFNKLVDVTKLSNKSPKFETIGGNKVAYVTSKSDVTWPLPAPNQNVKHGIIITEGDVTLNGDFNGLIIAGGDVNIGATNITVNADKKMVEEAMALDKASADPMIYYLLSRYFRKSVDATIGTSASMDLDNVYFENWKKN